MVIHVEPDQELTLEGIAELIEQTSTLCISCHGDYLGKGNIYSKDHPDGIPIKGYAKPQWVYFKCPSCGYENALWKVLDEIETKYMEIEK